MTRDIDLNSNEWCELVFEGKNQKYGAYYLRKTSSKRHLKALLIVVVFGLIITFLPTLIKTVMPTKTVDVESGLVELSDLAQKQEVPEENQIKEIEAPPPPVLKETAKFTTPTIAKDEEVRDEDLMKSQQELTETKAAISVADVKGATDGTGVDIADLQEHKVVTAAPEKEQIYENVEVMPEFPGGQAELLKYLSNNLKYPVIAQEQGVQGTVSIRFVVDKEGNVGEVEVRRSLDPSCDKEAVRVVKSLPKWIPGKQNGRPVSVYYNVPVRFRLQN